MTRIQLKHDDNSNDITQWSTKKLKTIAKETDGSIYETECYSTDDMRLNTAVLHELNRRGIRVVVKTSLSFVEED